MTKWVVVLAPSGGAYLCKQRGDYYEVEAEGASVTALSLIANELNKAAS